MTDDPRPLRPRARVTLTLTLGVAALALTHCGPPATAGPGPVAANPFPRGSLWLGPDELAALPTSGPAWDQLRAAAARTFAPPDLQNGEQDSNVLVLARALVHARTGDARCREEVVAACREVIGTEDGHQPGRPEGWQAVRALGPARELPAYVLAADLVGLPSDLDDRFRAWLRRMLDTPLGGHTLRTAHEQRPNNWGTHAGAARIAIAAYLGDRAELARAAQVFRGWLGDRAAYRGFRFRGLDWQADPGHPVGVNPAGASRDGHSIDGVLPDDQRRAETAGGEFCWPPPRESYVWEALQGALVQAVLLARAGYPDVFEWQDRALLRAYRWLYDVCAFPAEGDDTWQLPVVDRIYGTRWWDGQPTRPGKNVGFTCWTHGGSIEKR